MSVSIIATDDQYILNHCTKYLARQQGQVTEAWRFPVIDAYGSYNGRDEYATNYGFNLVTFVHDGRAAPAQAAAVIGTFANLHEPLPLRPVTFLGEDTGYRALSVVVPKGEVHLYKFVLDGVPVLDPINPQRALLDNGREWSRFFTQLCTQPISFERWEYDLLFRLTDHILPFRTKEARNFLQRHYFNLDRRQRDTAFAHAYQLDNSVGVVNFIDNLVSREEIHRLIDYRICLNLIDQVLRRRNPHVEPTTMPREMYVELYEQMARDSVDGWDYSKYSSPRFFLQILRRHTFTGAFSHPKYGGNSAASAWAYLSERYTDDDGTTLFDWPLAVESPLGRSVGYRG